MVHLFKPIYHPFFNGKCISPKQRRTNWTSRVDARRPLRARWTPHRAPATENTRENIFLCRVLDASVLQRWLVLCVCVCIDRRERTSEEKNRASSGVESLQTSLFLLRGRSLRRRRSLCSRLAHNFFFTARSDSHLFDHIRHFIAV